MTAFILYGTALLLLFISYLKDKEKTRKAVNKAWKSFENIMPQFLGVIFVVGITLAILKPEVISQIIGKDSGFYGVFISSMVGSITIMPTFVAFQTADILLKNGAGYAQVGALVNTLTMVGIVTLGMESKFIGKKAALLRNFICFLFSFIVAFIIGKVVGGN